MPSDNSGNNRLAPRLTSSRVMEINGFIQTEGLGPTQGEARKLSGSCGAPRGRFLPIAFRESWACGASAALG